MPLNSKFLSNSWESITQTSRILTENQISSDPCIFKRLFSSELGKNGDVLGFWLIIAGDTCWNCCWSKSCFCNGDKLSKNEVNGAPGRAVELVRKDSAFVKCGIKM